MKLIVEGIKRYRENPREDYLDERLSKTKELGIRVIKISNKEYPARLKEIRDAPPLLYVLGRLPKTNKIIAVVGTRNPTKYGKEFSIGISRELVRRGWAVVSGLARGIDTFAHKGALKAGKSKPKPTIAVVGCGLDRVYPPENEELFREISKKGAVISEHPIGTTVSAINLVNRNRIISGLSNGIIVVETGKRGGTIHTIYYADIQKKKIFYAEPKNKQAEQVKGLLFLREKKIFYRNKIHKISTDIYEIPVLIQMDLSGNRRIEGFGDYADFVISRLQTK